MAVADVHGLVLVDDVTLHLQIEDDGVVVDVSCSGVSEQFLYQSGDSNQYCHGE